MTNPVSKLLEAHKEFKARGGSGTETTDNMIEAIVSALCTPVESAPKPETPAAAPT